MLQKFECRNTTYLDPAGDWPIVWEKARGNHVWDLEGKKYLDLTAAFGVASTGHANPRVVAAASGQMKRLLHAMGDVHPHRHKAELARELSRLSFERWTGKKLRGKSIFCNSGFEAVEAALKTARLATGRREIISFEGGYHGLGYGALTATARSHFRRPFENQLGGFGHLLPWPDSEKAVDLLRAKLDKLIRRGRIGAILAEPIQVRGGIRLPAPGFLPMLREESRKGECLLILDEIYTGFGRTGRWFASEHFGVVPDLICLGKSLTGGFPLSACLGQSALMDGAWPASTGEAIHTSTFLGHPVGCRMALAQLKELKSGSWIAQSARLGKELAGWLKAIIPPPGFKISSSGLGLLAGVKLETAKGQPATQEALRCLKEMLRAGFLMLPEGEFSNVLAFTPPLTIRRQDLRRAVSTLEKVLGSAPNRLSARHNS